MPFIAFLGCDGSGKSAVIQGVNERLRAAGTEVAVGHWRPRAFAHPSSVSSETRADAPHGGTPRGFLTSAVKLGWLWTNWWVAWLRESGATSRRGVILFDRYHADLLIDPLRYRYGGSAWLARTASRLMPQPDRVIFLDAPPDVLLSRKQEVSAAALEKSRAAYLRLATGNPRFRIIDASRPLDAVIHDVISEIRRIS